jgi:hypothetical protein
MDTPVLVGIAVAAVAVLGAGGYALYRSGQRKLPPPAPARPELARPAPILHPLRLKSNGRAEPAALPSSRSGRPAYWPKSSAQAWQPG